MAPGSLALTALLLILAAPPAHADWTVTARNQPVPFGVRYRGERFGAYLEAGPSFVSVADGRFGEFVSERRWFPQLSAGMSFAVW